MPRKRSLPDDEAEERSEADTRAPARSDNKTSPKEKPEGDVKPFVVPAASAFKPLTVACALRCIWQMPMPCSVC